MSKISATKASRISVGNNSYKLEPAESRTHPYAFHSKRADDAWFVVSIWDGKTLGLVQQWGDGEWSFSKISSHELTPQWLRAQHRGAPTTIYNLSSRLFTGASAADAIARGLGI